MINKPHRNRCFDSQSSVASRAQRSLGHTDSHSRGVLLRASATTRFALGSRRQGREWVAPNPRRLDRRPGSFKVNLATGRRADFTTGDCGGAAYLFGLSQAQAKERIATMLVIGGNVDR